MPNVGPGSYLYSRKCQTCGTTLVQKPKEHLSRFELRQFCGRKCMQKRKTGGLFAIY